MTRKYAKHLIYSDLHLERGQRSDGNRMAEQTLIEINNQIAASRNKKVVLLVGDIHSGTSGVKWAKQINAPVIYVPGNHEMWDGDYFEQLDELKTTAANSNVHVLINDSFELNGVIYIGLMLWTDLGSRLKWPNNENKAVEYSRSIMNDYHTIKAKSWYTAENIELFNTYDHRWDSQHTITHRRWNAFIQIEEHNKSRNYLVSKLKELKDDQRPVVVVGHHPPLYNSLFESRFKQEVLYLDKYNERFYMECAARRMTRDFDTLEFLHYGSDLKDDIFLNPDLKKPVLWVHGHIHTPVDYVIGSTRVKSNPIAQHKTYNTEVDIDKNLNAVMAEILLDKKSMFASQDKLMSVLTKIIDVLNDTNSLHFSNNIDNDYYLSVLSLLNLQLCALSNSFVDFYRTIFEYVIKSLQPEVTVEHLDFQELVSVSGIEQLMCKNKLASRVCNDYKNAFDSNLLASLFVLNVHDYSSCPYNDYTNWLAKQKKSTFGGDHYSYWLKDILSFKETIENNYKIIELWLNLMKKEKLKDFHVVTL